MLVRRLEQYFNFCVTQRMVAMVHVYVYGFLQIRYSLYIIDNVLLQRYLFFVDYNLG